MKLFMVWVTGVINQLVTWVIRPRNLGIAVLSRSTLVLTAALAGGFTLEVKGAGFVEALKFSTAEGAPAFLLALVTYAGLIGWVIGLALVIGAYWRESKEAAAGPVLVAEMRGLVDTADQPLLKAVPVALSGRREDCLIDVRAYLTGVPPNVTSALDEISHLRRQVRRARGDTARENVKVVAGGVMQVPLLVYAGTQLDDEGKVTLLEWERTSGQWKQLLEPDDLSRFDVSGLIDATGAAEVVVAVSASYKVDFDGIAETFAGKPVVHLGLPEPKVNGLWSEENQVALTHQFLQTLGTLANAGVKTVYLVLAAPATLALRFGMAYDPRNMPDLLCYQRERGNTPPFPWSVQMPTDSKPVAYIPTVVAEVAMA